MAFLVVFVLDDPDRCDDLLDAWESRCVTGVTILESTGLGRVRRAGLRDDIPLMPSLGDLLRGRETHHRTLLSAVDNEEQVNALVEATQSIVGDLDQPHTGVMFVLPIIQAFGIEKRRNPED